ncbi:hypothetical protein D9M69_687100 [compost metagenome]
MKSPSRTRLAANESFFKGWLISRAINAAPARDSAAAVASQISQVAPVTGPTREGSVSSQ